jgi:hypothetical protein
MLQKFKKRSSAFLISTWIVSRTTNSKKKERMKEI